MQSPTHRRNLTYDAAERILAEGGGMTIGEILACSVEGDPSDMLLSDQCQMSIRLLVRGEEPRAWGGCMLGQFIDSMGAIDASNPAVVLKWRSEFVNTFPHQAVHEALANALIHCDASAGDSIDVMIGGGLMTIRSPGRSNFRSEGGMLPRNRALASAMASMGWVSLKTRGMMSILDAYRRTWSIPSAEDSGRSFLVTLPAVSPGSKDIAAVMDRAFDILYGRPGLTAEAISRELLISLPAVRAALSSMEAMGRVFSMGPSDSLRYYQCAAPAPIALTSVGAGYHPKML